MRQTPGKRFTSVALATALALMGLALPPNARAEVVLNVKVPFAIFVAIPCSGDTVLLTGDLHVLSTLETDNNGGTHFKNHSQSHGISGIGVPSGAKYRATGVSQSQTNTHSSLASEFTFIDTFSIIGQGKGNNLLFHQTIHVTVNANGDVTATVANISVDCK